MQDMAHEGRLRRADETACIPVNRARCEAQTPSPRGARPGRGTAHTQE